MEEFSHYKENVLQETKVIASKYKERVDGFRSEIEGMNSKFQEKIAAFEAVNKELKAALDDSMKNGSAGLEGMKRAHEREIEDLVRSNNEKYQQIIISHLREMESMTTEMESRIQEAKVSVRKEMTVESEQKLGQLRAQLDGDKQSALMEQKRDFDDKLKGQRDDASAKLEGALSEIQKKTAEANRLKAELDAMKLEMERKIRDFEGALAAQSGDASQQVLRLQSIISSKERDILALQAVADERIQEIAQLKSRISENESLVGSQGKTIDQQKKDIVELMDQLAIAGNATEASETALRTKIVTLEKDVSSMTEDISKNGKLLLATRDELKRSEANAKAAASDAVSKIDSLKNEVENLQRKLADALALSRSSEDGLAKELESLRKKLLDGEEKYRANMADLSTSHGKAVESIKSSHEKTVSELRQALEDALQKGSSNDAASKQAMASMKAEYEEHIATMSTSHKLAMDDAIAAHNAEVGSMRATIEALEQQLQDVSSSADGEKGVLKSQLDKLEGKHKALQRELEAKKKDGERVESVVTGLKNQVESLREELKASQAAYREKMESSLAKLDADWQVKMDALIAEHALSLAAAETAAEHRLLEQLAELRAQHEQDVSVLKSALKKEASDASEELVKAEHERLRLEEELAQAKRAHESAVQQLLVKHKAELEAAEQRRKKEIESLHSDLSLSASSSLAALKEKHNYELSELQTRMDNALAALVAKHANEIEASNLLTTNILKRELAELEAKMLGEKTTALATSAARHANELANLQEERDLSMGKLKDKISELEKGLLLSQGDVKLMQGQIEGYQRERSMREEQVVLERDSMQRDFNSDLLKEKDRGHRALTEAAQRSAQDMKEAQQHHSADRLQLEEVILGLKGDLKALIAKYNSRESRQEDLAEIARLQEEMVEKDRLVVQTREEMMYFKREMLNREESYNEKFNRQPNVGVMNVIKNKTPSSEKAGVGGGGPGGKKAAPAQFRPLNPSQAGGGIPGVGGIGGGLGNMAMSGSAPMATSSVKR